MKNCYKFLLKTQGFEIKNLTAKSTSLKPKEFQAEETLENTETFFCNTFMPETINRKAQLNNIQYIKRNDPFKMRLCMLPLVIFIVLGLFLISVPKAFSAIAIRGTYTTGTSTNSNLTINKPTGVVAGDVMIVNIAKYGSSTPDPSLTGWTLIAGSALSGSSGGSSRYGGVLYRVVDGTEGTSFTFALGTSSYATGSIVAFSGVDQSIPFDVAPGSISTPSGTAGSVTVTSITTATANAAVILFGMNYYSSPARTFNTWTTASPALTEIYDYNNSTRTGVGAAWGIKTTAGSTGTSSITLSGSTSTYVGGILVALKAAIPTITSLGSSSGCVGSSLVITGTNLLGATAVTIGGTAATITANTLTTVTVTVGSGTTGTVTVTLPFGSATSGATFTIYQPPTTSIAGTDQTDNTTCGLTQVTLAGNNPSVGAGLWTVTSGTGGSFGSSSSYNSTFSGTAGTAYTLQWAISNGSCTQSTSTVHVTFNQNPTASNAGTDQTSSATCGLTQVTLAGNNPSVGAGLWTVTSGTGGSFGSSPSYNSTFSGTAGTAYTLQWAISNSPCTQSTSTVHVTFNQNPTASNAGTDQTGSTTCGLTQLTLAGNNATVGIGLWTVTSGTGGSFGSSSSYNSTFSGTAGTAYTLQWAISNSPCTQSTSTVHITFNPLPAAFDGVDRSICIGNATVVGTTAVGGDTYSWSSTPAGFSSNAANPSVTPTLTTTYTVTETITATNCHNTNSVIVTVSNPVTSVTNQTNISCYAGSDGTITINATGGIGSYQYSVDNGSSYTPGSSPYTYTGLSANVQYKIRVMDSIGCTSIAIP